MKQQINSLTASRAFAAVMIYIFHFGRDILPMKKLSCLFNSANLAVSYFFVLSGFVLYISYRKSSFTYGNFLSKRAVRIAPAYFLALGLSVILYFYFYKSGYSPDYLKQLIYSLLFIQAYIPGYALSLNIAAWSISVEMFFYILFPWLLVVQKKNNRLFIYGTIVLFILTQAAYIVFFKRDFSHIENFTFFVYSPAIHIHEFLIGMIGGFLFERYTFKKIRFAPLPTIILCVIIGLIVSRSITNLDFQAGLMAPLFMALILATAVYNPRFLNVKTFIFLGEISYGIYILQFLVHEFLLWLNIAWMKLPEQTFFYFSFVVLCIAATISYYCLEQPLRSIVNRRLAKKQ